MDVRAVAAEWWTVGAADGGSRGRSHLRTTDKCAANQIEAVGGTVARAFD